MSASNDNMKIYRSIGISIDKKFMEAFLDLEVDDPDDL